MYDRQAVFRADGLVWLKQVASVTVESYLSHINSKELQLPLLPIKSIL